MDRTVDWEHVRRAALAQVRELRELTAQLREERALREAAEREVDKLRAELQAVRQGGGAEALEHKDERPTPSRESLSSSSQRARINLRCWPLRPPDCLSLTGNAHSEARSTWSSSASRCTRLVRWRARAAADHGWARAQTPAVCACKQQVVGSMLNHSAELATPRVKYPEAILVLMLLERDQVIKLGQTCRTWYGPRCSFGATQAARFASSPPPFQEALVQAVPFPVAQDAARAGAGGH